MWSVIIVGLGLLVGIAAIAYILSRRETCSYCFYPPHRCTCPPAPVAHVHDYSEYRWSQDGWVRRCRICPEIEYGGDDFDNGAPK